MRFVQDMAGMARDDNISAGFGPPASPGHTACSNFQYKLLFHCLRFVFFPEAKIRRVDVGRLQAKMPVNV